MAENVAGRAQLFDHAREVLRHVAIGVGRVPETLAMVAHVHRHHPPVLRQIAGQPTPVAPRAEQPVRNQQRRLIAGLTEFLCLKHLGHIKNCDRISSSVIS